MKNNISACFTSNIQDWKTPFKLYNFFMINGFYDPCPYKSDTLIDKLPISEPHLFINPPFNELSKWVDMIVEWFNSLKPFGICFLLMPLRFDTKYFKKLYPYILDIICFDKRLKFNDSNKSAPFPSCILKLGNPVLNIDTKVFHHLSLEKFIDEYDLIWGLL